MNDPERPIIEDDLHAYVDGQLDPNRQPELERHLAQHPDAARLVAAYQAQRAALRAAFADTQIEPLPPRLDLSRLVGQRVQRRRAPWRVAAGIVVALGVGGASGWFLHSAQTPGRIGLALQGLKQEALASHAVYATDRRHPIEVGAADAAHLTQWLSNRLGQKVAPPDLTALGYHLIGGRLLATEHGAPAALFMYDDSQGKRLSLLLRPMAPDLHAPQAEINRGAVNGCAWIAKGMGYAVVALIPDSEIDRVADHIRTELGTG